MHYEHQESRHYQVRRRHASSGLFATLFRTICYILLAIAVLTGGLWLIGAAVGLVVGLLALAIGLAPVIILVWLVWLVLKAIFV